MKKMISLLLVVLMLGMCLPVMGAMSINKMRQNARFLTDRMAYELHLSTLQYDDVYEVNYDFINSVRYIMDDVVRGHDYAVDRYYNYLNYRNEDLRWILSASQYQRFMDVEYFYRPIYTTRHNWAFRIYNVYMDVHHFYFGKPHHYKTYNGGHSRSHHHTGYYRHHHEGRYQHAPYKGHVDTRPAPKPSPSNTGRRPSNAAQPKPKADRPSANASKPKPKADRPSVSASKSRPKADRPSAGTSRSSKEKPTADRKKGEAGRTSNRR